MTREVDKAKLLYVTSRREWRDWLEQHHKSANEVWLVFFKKHTGKTRIPYNDAVEEALCFGWIDSIVNRIDDSSFAQRFSPRNPKTAYSQANKERLRELIKQGRVIDEVLTNLGNLADELFEIPADILESIRANELAWKNFQMFSESYIRIRIAFIEGARRRPEMFERRLKYFIEMTEKNKLFGFGGIEKYY
jgi:uncharacterized protein YdeI (YjbR/CyaY-like superfamily)